MRLDALPLQPFADAAEQLAADFRWLDARLAEHVRRLRAEGRFNDDPLRGVYLRGEDVLGDLSRQPPSPFGQDRLRAAIDARAALHPRPPLQRIADAAGLDAGERLALLLVAAPGLDRRYRTAFAYAQNDAGRGWPSIDLVAELVWPDDRLGALACFTATAPLIAKGLLSVVEGEQARPFADRALTLEDRVLAAIAGIDGGPDRRIAPWIVPPVPNDLRIELPRIDPPVGLRVVVTDCDVGQRQIAARAFSARGAGLCLVDAGRALQEGVDPAELAMLATREALLSEAGLALLLDDGTPPARAQRFLAEVKARGDAIVLAEPGAVDGAGLMSLGAVQQVLPGAAPATRQQWWQAAGAPRQVAARLAWTTSFGADAIAAIAREEDGHWEAAARGIGARRMPPVLERVHPRWSRAQLVVSAPVARQLDELIAFAAHAPAVLGAWGFGTGAGAHRRCVALFAGPSGTGKTMAASIVAEAAGLELYRASLAAVFDKFIGETEKQIDRLFRAAADGGAAVLFDEADVLFGTRTETHDAHDRYANLSTAYILQRIEAHEGLVLLSSNLPRNMDSAFARRLTHNIAFALPDAAQREQLWRRAFPPAAAIADDIAWAEIAATFELSGGNIANAALAAAYLAAAEGRAIGSEQVLRAIVRELEKIGRAPIAADFGRLAPPG